MSRRCLFPDHHKPGGDGSLVLALVAVVVGLVLVAELARLALAAWSWVTAHPWVLLPVAAWLLWRPARALVGIIRAPAGSLRHVPRMTWAALRWRWLARNAHLAYTDQYHRRLLRPRLPWTTGARMSRAQVHKLRYPAARFTPDPYGWTATLRTIPRVGQAEVDAAAASLADHWRAHRVSVHQDRPGRLQVRALRRDPLAEPLDAAALPAFDGRHVTLGRDEHGAMRVASLANLSGCAFSGNPGRGKTEAALSLACQLAPSPLVDFYLLDGGACDWAHFADGAAGYVADDLDAAADLLHELAAGMSARRRTLEADLGVRNGWQVGPSPGYRLRWLLVEEAPFYLDAAAVKGDRKREALVATCCGLLGGLLRRGRAPMHFTTLVAQKGTGSGGLPPDLRDLCGLRWSFGVSTTEAAVAVLGEAIRQYPTLSPTGLQDQPGIASALLATGTAPYTLLRFPAVGQDRADQAAAEMAKSRTHPEPVHTPPLAAVPDPAAA